MESRNRPYNFRGLTGASTDVRLRVLLIEDDEDDYLLTRELFDDIDTSWDFAVEWVQTYADGLDALRREDHDVCLLDYHLGARDGLELLCEAQDEGCRVPIIVLTGAGNRQVDRTAMGLGADDYLVKAEITAELLERSIRHTLERRRAQESLRRAIEMRDEVQRIVAHDLRAPLTTISMVAKSLEIRLSETPDGEELFKHFDVQQHAVSRMSRLIEDLLDIAQIEAGSLAIEPERYAPGVLIDDVREQHLAQAEDKLIYLDRHLPECLPDVYVDPDRIEQVFSNLTGNALKFTSAGGRIVYSATERPGTIVFSVSDTGSGIPADQLPRLFDRFWRADGGGRDGAGLGLAICKGIVEAHGGKIWVESEVGSGTTVYFSVPVAGT